jgi:UTP-glucose-1-phosphate uridylyltransferase/mevalonate kinase
LIQEPAVNLFVPGRICLLGEHSDWAGGYRRINPDLEAGYAIICGTNQGIYAEVEAHNTHLVLTATTPDGQHRHSQIPMEADILLGEAQAGGFWSYVAGVAYQAMANHQVGGLVLNNYRTDLPIQKGLSSSAAICVLAARAFNRLYNLHLTTRGEMELAYQGELTTPSRCGRMDQGCAFGSRPVLMTFDGDRLETRELHLTGDLHLVVVDLHAKKNTQEILARLNDGFPLARNEDELALQNLLGLNNKRIIHQAVEALEHGEAARLGALMTQAQQDFDRDAIPLCPQELVAPVLHKVLNHPPIQGLIWGGKGVGSQGDGSAQLLARSKADQDVVIRILENDLGLTCIPLNLQSGSKVRKAVIPAAGFGTRLFPASKATKKELFPIIDRDGIAKPAIMLIVEEALQAGIEEIILIVQQEDLEAFNRFFNQQISPENYNKLPPHFQEYSRRILEIGQKIAFVIQDDQEGFGHAVYCAREAVNNEPFLLMLGDHIYRSTNNRSCAQQLVQAYQQHGQSVVGMRLTPQDKIANFGTLTGVWQEDQRLLNITEFAEKPGLAYARTHLRPAGLPQDQYLTVFGQYILNPEIFTILEERIRNNLRERGEFQLTSALERLRQADGCLGLVIEGDRYDIGLPDDYLDTLNAFRK